MAADIQQATADKVWRPFTTLEAESRRDTNIPHARLIHRGDLDLDGSGVGDTAYTVLTLPLEGRNVYILNALQWYLIKNDTSSIEYDLGFMTIPMYDRPVDEFGQHTEINIPITFSQNYAPFTNAVATRLKYLSLGAQLPTNEFQPVTAWGVTDPARLMLLGPDLGTVGSVDPSITISAGEDTAVDNSTNLRYWFEWLVYDYEQCLNMPLHYRSPVR